MCVPQLTSSTRRDPISAHYASTARTVSGALSGRLRNARFGGANEGARTISPTHIDRDLARPLGNKQ